MARYLLESGAPDGYLLEDGSGVLLMDCSTLDDAAIALGATMDLKFNESAGSTITDATGNGHDGTKQANVTLGSTVIVGADTSADFTGSTPSYVDVPDSAAFDIGASGSSPFSVLIVIKRDTFASDATIISKGNSGGDGFCIRYAASGSYLVLGNASRSNDDVYGPITTDTARHMYLITWSGSAGHIYEDAVDITESSDVTLHTADNAQTFRFGADNPTEANNIDGKLGRGIWFPSALTAANAVTLYGLIDQVCAQSLSRTADDSLALGNAVTRLGTFVRTAADSLSMANVVTRVGTFLRTAGDSLTLGNVVAAVRSIVRTLADSLAIGNTVTRVGTFIRTTADSLTMGNTVVRVASLIRTATDSLGFGDAVVRVLSAVRTAADSLSIGNTVTRVGTFLRTAGDSLSFADAVNGIRLIVRSAADSLNLGNTVARTGTFLRSATDALSLGNTVTRALTLARTTADSLSLGNTVARIVTAVRTASDALGMSEAVARVLSAVRTAADALSFADVVTAIQSGAGVIGGIARQTATAVHSIPGVITSHLRPSGGASNVTPPAGASHVKPDGEADHEVPE